MKNFWLLHIAGCKYVFGNAQAYTYAGYTYMALLDETSVEEASRDEWSLREGKATAGSLSLSLFDEDDFLNTLFAGFLASMARTQLMGDLAWGGSETTIDVMATGAFPASGDLHRGLECISYTGKTSTSFTGCTRGKYGSMKFHHPIEGDTDPDMYGNPYITSAPLANTWRRRLVTLYRADVDDRNTIGALSAVWAGYLNELRGQPDGSYRLTAPSLMGRLEETVGYQDAAGTAAKLAVLGEWRKWDASIFWYLDANWQAGYFTYKDTNADHTYGNTINFLACPVGVFQYLGELWANIRDAIYAETGNHVTLGYDGVDRGEDVFPVIRNTSTTRTVEITGPLEFFQALGFDGNIITIGPEDEVTAANPLARSFHSASPSKLYVEDLAPFQDYSFDYHYHKYIAAFVKNRVHEGYCVARIVGTGTDAYGDYLNLLQLGRAVNLCIWTDSEDYVPVRGVLFADAIDSITFILQVLTSTGGGQYNGTYDQISEWGLAIPEANIYIESFEALAGGRLREYVIASPTTAWDFLAEEMKLLGARLYQRDAQLAICPIGDDPVFAAREIELDDEAGDFAELIPEIELDTAFQVSLVRASYNWDENEEKFSVEDEIYQASESKALASDQSCALTTACKGLQYLDPQEAQSDLLAYCWDLWQKFGQGVFSITATILMDSVTSVYEGDVVRLTHSKLRSPISGTMGVATLTVSVWQARRLWQEGGIELVLLLFPQFLRTSTFAPCAEIVSYDDVTGELVVEDHTFCQRALDASFFHENDEVEIVRASVHAEGTKVDTTIADSNGSVLRVGTGLSFGGPAIAAGDLVRFQSWTAVVTRQKQHVALAGTDKLLNGTDPPFVLGGGGSI